VLDALRASDSAAAESEAREHVLDSAQNPLRRLQAAAREPAGAQETMRAIERYTTERKRTHDAPTN